MRETLLTGITGGIGAGKSVVSRVLALRGYTVYDCDSCAKELMDSDPALREAVCSAAGRDLYSSGTLDRRVLAEVIFSDEARRRNVNRVVHAAVRRDIEALARSCADRLLFVESAILVTSHLDEITDAIWLVTAPEPMRMQRVMQRNPEMDAARIERRMRAQDGEFAALPAAKVTVIPNDGLHPLLEAVDAALRRLEAAL